MPSRRPPPTFLRNLCLRGVGAYKVLYSNFPSLARRDPVKVRVASLFVGWLLNVPAAGECISDPITLGAWQSSHWSVIFKSLV